MTLTAVLLFAAIAVAIATSLATRRHPARAKIPIPTDEHGQGLVEYAIGP